MAALTGQPLIAVIGGRAICSYVMQNCARIGFAGPVWHVHPTRGEFASIAELPEAPDVGFVGVNRRASIDIVAELRDRGAGGAVAYASGFSEAMAESPDGADFQARLLDAAGDMVLVGPNCYGYLNYLDGAGLWPDQQGGIRVDRGVAIITQSSNIAINLSMQKRGLPLAYLVTAGNQAQTGLAEIGVELLKDPRVTALGLHIEGIGEIGAFETLGQVSRGLGKPVVAIKTGVSDQARAATVSHTASLAGSAAGARAFLARLGIAQVTSLEELLETLKLLHVCGPLRSNRIASMSCSGGEAGLMADAALSHRVTFPALDNVQISALRNVLGDHVALANPLDYNTYIWGDADAMAQAFSALMSGDLAIGAVVADFPRADRCSSADWEPVIAAAAATGKSSGKPMAIIASLPENMPEKTAKRLIDLGIAPLNGIRDALGALDAAAWLGEIRSGSRPVLRPGTPQRVVTLTEAQGKAALAGFGLDVPRAQRVRGSATLAAAAERLGYPLALKGEGIEHKTEAGAVAINLKDASQVIEYAAKMKQESFLLEEMITGGIVELLVGVVRDPAHGYVLTLAAGGTGVEILQDSTNLLLPTTSDEISKALNDLRLAPLLAGYRGACPVSIDKISAAVLAVQNYVAAHAGRIEEVEINPLICTATRAVAADVLIRIGEADD